MKLKPQVHIEPYKYDAICAEWIELHTYEVVARYLRYCAPHQLGVCHSRHLHQHYPRIST